MLYRTILTGAVLQKLRMIPQAEAGIFAMRA
jgi:hypothetical protein